MTPFGRLTGGRKRQLQPCGVRIVQRLWNFIGGCGSYGLPAIWKEPWLLTSSRSNSQPAVTVCPPSLISSRTGAASGMIQPAAMASTNGRQRLTVRPLFVADTCSLSTPGRCRNHAGRTLLAGTGSAMTPLSSGRHRNSMVGRALNTARPPSQPELLLELELEFELELLLEFELLLLLELELLLELWFELLFELGFELWAFRRLIVRRLATARARHHSIGFPSIFRSTVTTRAG